MTKSTKYYQCRIERQTDEGLETDVAWLDAEKCDQFSRISIKGKEGIWTITSIDKKHSLSAVELNEKTRKDRNSTPSLEGLS
jgi:hypothetical protein